jgi:hypothetical protein
MGRRQRRGEGGALVARTRLGRGAALLLLSSSGGGGVALVLLGIVFLGVALASVGGEARSQSRTKLGGGGTRVGGRKRALAAPDKVVWGGVALALCLALAWGRGWHLFRLIQRLSLNQACRLE